MPRIPMAALPLSLAICQELDALDIENFEHRSFIPFEKLQQLFTREKVEKLLETSDVKFYDREDIAKAILDGGRKVFAILASIQEISAITRFVERDSFGGNPLDARLPFDETALAPIFPQEHARRSFFRKQWRFLAPSFHADQSHRTLSEHTITPFVSSKRFTDGAYGDIYRVTVEGSHHNIQPGRVHVSKLQQ